MYENTDPPLSTPATGNPAPAKGFLSRLFARFAGLFASRGHDTTIRDALEELIEEREEMEGDGGGVISADERLLIANVLKMRDVIVSDVMVPRAEIVSIEASATREEIVEMLSREAHSRVPVYRETLDDAIGMIHIKDVLAAYASDAPFDIHDIVRKVLFVSPTMRILDLLLQMRLARVHLALVVDEFGGVDGLVTIEDAIEEIVGDIQDEHDVEDIDLIERPDGSLIADARTEIEAFEDRVGPILTPDEREDVDTLGGLVVELAGRVPSRGEVIRHSSGVEFEVIDADPRRVKRLRLRRLPRPRQSNLP
ncbi:MAG: CBS domain-containing protein [Alphaproteobacteria bacterium]|nr:CBS domain-containing protein [Alphaproteobacteria bacterium]